MATKQKQKNKKENYSVTSDHLIKTVVIKQTDIAAEKWNQPMAPPVGDMMPSSNDQYKKKNRTFFF